MFLFSPLFLLLKSTIFDSILFVSTINFQLFKSAIKCFNNYCYFDSICFPNICNKKKTIFDSVLFVSIDIGTINFQLFHKLMNPFLITKTYFVILLFDCFLCNLIVSSIFTNFCTLILLITTVTTFNCFNTIRHFNIWLIINFNMVTKQSTFICFVLITKSRFCYVVGFCLRFSYLIIIEPI